MLNALRPVTKLLIHWRFRDFAHLAASDGWVFDEKSLKPLRAQPIKVSADSFQFYQRYSHEQIRELRSVFWVCFGFVAAGAGALGYAIFVASAPTRLWHFFALPFVLFVFGRGVLSSWAQSRILSSIHRTVTWKSESGGLAIGTRAEVAIHLDARSSALAGILARHIGGIVGQRSCTVVESDEIDGARHIKLDAIEGDSSSSKDRISLLVPAN
ncbi:MAG: hypothetical protein ACFHWZ_17250 [Phycisphaerales bacterium]